MMDLDEFREKGYLLEINRSFLHPLGMALALVHEDGRPPYLDVIDHRDDPEGVYFDDLDEDDVRRVSEIEVEWERRRPAREAALGYMVQPLRVKVYGKEP